ncbi:XRE family transcriptional regulator [Duncaniella dubosii]|uniref:XRE family transcriptional regulator n=1 Tax=Duncaniella dubosii TaxID=2518971 RepID=A0A4P7W0T9_9BACT|nr:helix-turn-helix transcriptional regulator [Duncaniella dubosii]QCD41496.1 XRE family transcriptional regulator [Duncaniella dubosii]
MLDSDTMDRYVADGKSSNGSLRGVVGISVDDVSVAESAGGESAQVSQIDSEAIIGRVRYLMGLKRLSQRRLAALLRIDASNLSKVLNGKLPFSEGLVNRIVADLGVSKPWLRDGTGLPFDKQPIAKEISPDDMPIEQKSFMPRLSTTLTLPPVAGVLTRFSAKYVRSGLLTFRGFLPAAIY